MRPVPLARSTRMTIKNNIATPPRRKPPTGGGNNGGNNGEDKNDDMFGDGQRMALNKLFYAKMTPGYLNILTKKQFQRPVHMSIVIQNGYYILKIEPIVDYVSDFEDTTDYDIICGKINYWGLSSYVTDKIKETALTWFTTSIDISLNIPVEGERVKEFMPNSKCEDLEEM
jgi:hypothetical protein